MKRYLPLAILLLLLFPGKAEVGYRLWLRYDVIQDKTLLASYQKCIKAILIDGNSPTLNATREELLIGLNGLLNTNVKETQNLDEQGLLVCTTISSKVYKALKLASASETNHEGFRILNVKQKGNSIIVIAGNSDAGALYGAFTFLKLLQTHQSIDNLRIMSSPKIKLRLLNHWDNLDRTVERGYAGASIWDWHKLPEYIDSRYIDYARANASIGINGTVLTNVNANALVLSDHYLEKVAALANVFRPYGIRVYLTARFSAPIELGKLPTADPMNKDVIGWWTNRVNEIYKLIPDFGGFLVKANSEGQPGPQNYDRTHKDGANMLAKALQPYNGVVMWRAFVYDNNVPDDRHKQAYTEFTPFDGQFDDNVLIQVKNGAIDFQPREPFHPLFGAMPKTPLMMEFQITQEYLGFSTHLVYLAPLFKETLESDTYAQGKGSTVAKVIDGSLDGHSLTGIAGVSNIGSDQNWCGHLFLQANWFAYGRLAWDPYLSSEAIADEWISMTFTNNEAFIKPVKAMMLTSRETTVNYMTPLGLHHIMGQGHHYGPGPWVSAKNAGRVDWSSVYYHRADSAGIGFNRTPTGSDATSQYKPEVTKVFADIQNCPEKYLLWFHHVDWDYKMSSGNTLWEELCYRYYEGGESVAEMVSTWSRMKGLIDDERHEQVKMLLSIQYKEAVWWRNACLLYFQTFSKRPIPQDLEKPSHTLEYYMNLSYPYAPGIRPRW